MQYSSEYYRQFRVCYKTKNDNDTSPNTNKEDLKGTVQKSTMSKEELKSVCSLSLSRLIDCRT